MSLKELVVCKFAGCNQVFNDPRILPCGKRTCAAHIEEMTMKHDGTSSDRKIKCHFCHKIHVCSDKAGEGFLVDENISLLLNMKYCHEHEAAKKSFNEVTQLLAKLTRLDAEAYANDYFARVESDIVLEKEINMQKLLAHYQTLIKDLHERKAKCLNSLSRRNAMPASALEPINQTLKNFDSKLKKDNLDFILKTVDGDQVKWKTIESECNAMMEKVKSLEEQLNEIVLGDEMIGFRPSLNDTPVEDFCGQLDTRVFDSLIITSFKMENDLFEVFTFGDDFDCELIYRASRDGFEASSFHGKCDNKAGTLTIIRTTNGCIFGAHTTVAWDSTSGYKADPHAFIFSLVNVNSTPAFFRIRDDDKHAILCKAGFGPIFGRGHDIAIGNKSNTTTESYSNLGKSYKFTKFKYGTFKAQSFLAGARNFQTSEIEVFSVNKSDSDSESECEVINPN